MTATNNIESIHNVHPWRRYFARLLDILLMSFVFGVSLVILLPSVGDMVTDLAENKALDMILSGFFAMLLNPFFISLFGATPGKYLFGIQVRDKNTKKLSLLTALKREFLVYMKGMAFCIPFANIFTLISSHSRLKKQGNTSWDETLNCSVLYRENNLTQKILNVIGVVAYALILVAVALPDRTNTAFAASTPDNKTVVDKKAKNKSSTSDDIAAALVIYKAKKNGYIGRNKYIALMTSCSDKGNIYCSGLLGDFYYGESEYALAYPLLLSSTEMQFGLDEIEYELGYLLANGYGTAKNENEAIGHFRKSANLGYSDGAYSLGVIYGNRAAVLLDKNPSAVEVIQNLTQSYAWYKVAKALGQETSLSSDSRVQDIDISIERRKKLLIARSGLDDANKLATQLCSLIEECKHV